MLMLRRDRIFIYLPNLGFTNLLVLSVHAFLSSAFSEQSTDETTYPQPPIIPFLSVLDSSGRLPYLSVLPNSAHSSGRHPYIRSPITRQRTHRVFKALLLPSRPHQGHRLTQRFSSSIRRHFDCSPAHGSVIQKTYYTAKSIERLSSPGETYYHDAAFFL